MTVRKHLTYPKLLAAHTTSSLLHPFFLPIPHLLLLLQNSIFNLGRIPRPGQPSVAVRGLTYNGNCQISTVFLVGRTV